jgi:hypothetical protein
VVERTVVERTVVERTVSGGDRAQKKNSDTPALVALRVSLFSEVWSDCRPRADGRSAVVVIRDMPDTA